MAKINLLDKSIFNRIAAGEVVERPASIVKELVENSIDAGATNITIEVSDGGIRKIRVIDNGYGMSFDDLPKAFMPHATSKITTLDDLNTIGTLGFRGEALSSIASVAKVTATTKQYADELGSKIEIDCGEMTSHIQIGASDGTTIMVENLFANVPARAKFLKKPKQEEGEITNMLSRLILANPHIAIKYVADEKIVFMSSGTDLKDAIYTVYGKVAVESILPVDFKRDFFKVTGYIGKPTYTKPNRTYQTLMINNRYVINQAVSTAAYKAYEGFLMKGNFPFFVLNIEIPLDKVDVNVHPNKLDVKFEESNKIFGIILTAVSEVLLKHTHLKSLEKTDDSNIISMPKFENKTTFTNPFETKTNFEVQSTDKSVVQSNSTTEYVDISQKATETEERLRSSLARFLDDGKTNEFEVRQDFGFASSMVNRAMEQIKMAETSEETSTMQSTMQNTRMFENTPHKIVGVVFGTYVVVEQLSNMFVIDQHAAHERILYDKFKNQLLSRELILQDLLVPYILDTNYQESNFINSNLKNFENAGFNIEPFGANSFKVSSVPLVFKNIKLNKFFEDVLKDVNTTVNLTTASIIEDYLARKACRSAVKANDFLTDFEIDKLLEDLNRENQILLCPHGRPIVVKITQTEIEKWFKRIV